VIHVCEKSAVIWPWKAGYASDNYPSAENGMNLDVGFLTSTTPRGFPPDRNGGDPHYPKGQLEIGF